MQLRPNSGVCPLFHQPMERTLNKRALLLASAILASLLALLTPVIFGALQPDYSHIRDYISELGATGTPYAYWVNYGGFLTVGILAAVVGVLLPSMIPRSPSTIAASTLFFCLSIGYLGAAFMPCDAGCPAQGTFRQSIHNLSGIIEYLGMAISLLLFALAFIRDVHWKAVGWLSLLSAVVVLFSFGALATPELQHLRGLSQRIAEISIFAWLLVVVIRAAWLSHTPRREGEQFVQAKPASLHQRHGDQRGRR